MTQLDPTWSTTGAGGDRNKSSNDLPAARRDLVPMQRTVALPAIAKPNLPITVTEWRRNSREVFRVTLDEFKGQLVIDVRGWWRGEDDFYRPGKSGLCCSVKHLGHLSEGLAAAFAMAVDLGLVERR